MSLFSRLFGGKDDAAETAEPEIYGDFRIYPQPVREGTVYRIAARVEAEVDGETKVHELIRADTLGDRDQAVEASIAKAKQAIDSMGKAIFT